MTSAPTPLACSDTAPWLERQLEMWARWQHGVLGIGLGYAGLSGARYRSQDERGTAVPQGDPVFDQRMLLTDRAIAGMPAHLQAIVKTQYLLDDSWTMNARAKRCRVSLATYYRRLSIAHAVLAERLINAG